jgi:putative membrane-bound dehydrogenase-like protein
MTRPSLFHLLITALALLTGGCKDQPSVLSLTEQERRMVRYSFSGAEKYPGTEARVFASEQWVINPTNIAVDARGRVWVCEAVNYREFANPQNPRRPSGDRIVILDDTNGDGFADKQTVFYEGNDMVSPLGIAVLGDKVIVSCSPNAWVFTDENGDDVPDKKEALFTGVGGPDNDHALHAFVFGPDGKLYFNFGNAGSQLLDKNGVPVKDRQGNVVNNSGKPYRQGMAFRCNTDGTGLEVLGHNFRNNYELAVNSFGEVFQSDNDDDGNFGVRINYLLEYGNYGYTDVLTGAGWNAYRLNQEKETPLRHWYQNDPGVVPNLLQTGSGSPSGMAIYEGDQLPEVFQGQMIHAEPGHHVVRAYPRTKKDAGYEARIQNLLFQEKDDWFRPVDVAVAPDGSLLVADWYDPGVGGHHAGDVSHGRIYRISAPGKAYKFSRPDLSTAEGTIEALKSPNMDLRYQAWQKLHAMGPAAKPYLVPLLESPKHHLPAQALWLLAGIPGRASHWITYALKHEQSMVRALGIRLARRWDESALPGYLQQAVNDSDPSVRREAAIALRHLSGAEADALWAKLAAQHTGADRWYLEALGIGADLYATDRWKALSAVMQFDLKNPAHQDLIWRMRAPQTLPLLRQLARNADSQTAPRYLRAMEFHPAKERTPHLLALAGDTQWNTESRVAALGLLGKDAVSAFPGGKTAFLDLLTKARGSEFYANTVDQLNVTDEYPHLLKMAATDSVAGNRIIALSILLKKGQIQQVANAVKQANPQHQENLVAALGKIGNNEACDLLTQALLDPATDGAIRLGVVNALGMDWVGEHRLRDMLTSGKLPENLRRPAAMRLLTAIDPGVQVSAKEWLAISSGAVARTAGMPSIAGDPKAGKAVYTLYCAQCHKVGNEGVQFGPALSAIGSKMGREGLYQAIANPSDGINFGYEGMTVTLRDGSILSGYFVSQTEQSKTLMTMGGIRRSFATSEVIAEEPLAASLMPSGLDQVMSEKELADLLAYLEILKSGALAVNP